MGLHRTDEWKILFEKEKKTEESKIYINYIISLGVEGNWSETVEKKT